jgi:hypothetical protein
MRRHFLSWLALYLATSPALADDLSAPIGGFPPVSGDVSYTGPGDIETFTAFYGIMAYSSATRGHALLIVCNSTGGTDIGCADMYSSTLNGALVPATIAGISCPGTNCTVKTAYDLTGNGNHTTQSTIANRPTLSASGGPGGSPAIFCKPNQVLTVPTMPTLTQPFSMSGVAVRTGNTTTFGTIINSGDNGPELPFGSSANSLGEYAGSVLTAAAKDGTWHAIQGLFNSASSSIYIDGSPTSGNAGPSKAETTINLCAGTRGHLDGGFVEAGLASGNQSSLFSSLNANQHSRYGF